MLGEQILCFVVMSILVALFTWIYLRDRRREFGLWVMGWIAIFVHFAVKIAGLTAILPLPFASWLQVVTLIVAGTFFLLSVSEVFRDPRQRAIFILAIGVAATLYFTGQMLTVTSPWFYVFLLCVSVFSGVWQAIRFYGLKSWYLYTMFALLLPLAAWVTYRASRGDFDSGMNFYLFGFFGVTAMAYYRRFHRFTPGVVFTSMSFLSWGLVFPISNLLVALNTAPPEQSFIWDMPKFFVAFGMILTLFENQTAAATTAARQYQTLFEGNMAAVYLTTFQGKLLDCNGAFLKMYGFETKEDAQATPTVSMYVEPSERESFLAALSARGQVLNYECRQRKRDGTLFWILERVTVVTDERG